MRNVMFPSLPTLQLHFCKSVAVNAALWNFT